MASIWKLVLLFCIFLFSHSVYFIYNLWVTKNGNSMKVLGTQFDSFWTFTLASVLLATPFLTIANFTFATGFYFGHRHFDQIWIVIFPFILGLMVSTSFWTFIFFKEAPSRGTLVGGLLAFTGLLIAQTWK